MNSRLLRWVSIALAAVSVLGLLLGGLFLGISITIVDDTGAAAAAVVLASPAIIGGMIGMVLGLAGATLADMADDVKTLRILGFGSSA